MIKWYVSSDYNDKLDEVTHSVSNNSSNIQRVTVIIYFVVFCKYLFSANLLSIQIECTESKVTQWCTYINHIFVKIVLIK